MWIAWINRVLQLRRSRIEKRNRVTTRVRLFNSSVNIFRDDENCNAFLSMIIFWQFFSSLESPTILYNKLWENKGHLQKQTSRKSSVIRGERHLSANYAEGTENRNKSPSWVNLATEMNEKDTYGFLNQNVAGMIFIYACTILKITILFNTNGCKTYKIEYSYLILSTHFQCLAIIRYFHCASESYVCTGNAANAVNINLFGDNIVFHIWLPEGCLIT